MTDPKKKLRQVELVPYNLAWSDSFASMAKNVAAILQENCIEIHHIGSTAIPHIYAKPIIDMLPIVKDLSLVDVLNSDFEKLGFTCMGEYGIKDRRFYWKSPERTHHIHLFQQGSPEISRYIQFKNFLLANPAMAQGYSIIKRCLAEVLRYDIENYVNGKSSFVQMIEYKAKVAKPAQLNAPDNVIIQPYNPIWVKLAEAEINAIKMMVVNLSYHPIHHLGSTAVPGLSSKPIIDLFIAIPTIKDALHWVTPLEQLGYSFWDENPDKTHLRFFKGMPPFGMARTHHVHIVESTDPTLADRILFRNILIAQPEVRLSYEELKQSLLQQYGNDREAYTDGKSDFIKNILETCGYKK